MNALKFGSKIAVCALSLSVASVAMAQNVRTKPAPARTVQPEVRKAAPSVNNAVSAAPKVESLEAFKQRVGSGAAAATAAEKAPVLSCSVEQFSDALAEGTRFSGRDAQKLVEQRVATMGRCGKDGVLGYDPEARDNYIAAGLEVSDQLNGRKIDTVPTAELDMGWAKGLADEKNRDAGTNAVTVESQISVARKLKTDCELRQY